MGTSTSVSPKGTSRDKHPCFTDRNQRSAEAFRLGLRGGPYGEYSVVGVISAFYDLFVGVSSFAAALIAKQYGSSAAFLMVAIALIAATFAGHVVFCTASFSKKVTGQLAEADAAR